jgi:predicted Ser/Thr protein kinase
MNMREWLGSLGLERYAAVFEENEIDFAVLKTMNEADLKEVGIDAFGPRRKILTAIAGGAPGTSSPAPVTDPTPAHSSTAPRVAVSAGLEAINAAGTFVADAPSTPPSSLSAPRLPTGIAALADAGTFIATAPSTAPVASSSRPPSQPGLSAPATTDGLPEPGQMLAGRYNLLDQIGKGAMGAVFHAWDVKLKQACAIKVVLPSVLARPGARELFVREAQRSMRLSHPNLLRVNGFEDSPLDFVVMEHIDGGNLTDRWHQNRKILPPDDVRAILLQVLQGLAYLHSEGLVHRDIKPDNVLLTKDGKVKVSDYGVATSLREQRQQAQVAGTLLYMAPEQLRGEAELDGRADLYAVGVMAHQLLLGSFPFDGANVDAVKSWHLSNERDLAALSKMPWGGVFARALAFAPDARWETADQMAEALKGPATAAVVRRDIVTVGAGGDVATVAEALGAVRPGGTVQLLSGEHECSVMLDSDLTIQGAPGAKATVYSLTGPVFTVCGGSPTICDLNVEQRTLLESVDEVGADELPASPLEDDDEDEEHGDEGGDEGDDGEDAGNSGEDDADEDEDFLPAEMIGVSAINISAGKPMLRSLVVRSRSSVGVLVRGSSTMPTIAQVRVTRCGHTGIMWEESASGSVVDSFVVQSRFFGFFVGGGANPHCRRVRVSGTLSGAGIAVDADASGRLDECESFENLGAGLSVDGNPAVAESKFYRSITGSGIEVWRGRGSFERCRSFENRESGMIVWDGDPTVRDSVFYGAFTEGGIQVLGGRGLFERCESFDNNGAGVAVYANGNPTVRDSRFYRSREHAGVSVFGGAQGLFVCCESFQNRFAGIEVKLGGNPEVRESKFWGSVETSGVIVADGGSGLFERCESFENKVAGIAVSTGGNPTVRDSQFHKHSCGWGIRVYSAGIGRFERSEAHGNRWDLDVDSASRPVVIDCRIGGVVTRKYT